MGDFDALADEIWRDRIRRARELSPEEKLLSGIELFEEALRMRDGVRAQFPDASEEQVRALVQERIDIVRRMEERNLYVPVVTQ